MNTKKLFSIILIVIVIVNMILYGIGLIHAIPFWIVIAVCAVTAYFVIPRMKAK
ncbi:hypothetical protein KY325_00135 [Candidatus Woesearchaeota archaeon]|nr:hypothetical protein [Candidatus Woesearchaeota archaeon]